MKTNKVMLILLMLLTAYGVAAQSSKQKMLKRMVELAHQLRAELQRNNLDAFGEIIHANWELKKGLAREISTLSRRSPPSWFSGPKFKVIDPRSSRP